MLSFPWAFVTSLLICRCCCFFFFSSSLSIISHTMNVILSLAVYLTRQDTFFPIFLSLPFSCSLFRSRCRFVFFPRVIMIMSSLWQCHCHFIKLMSLQFYSMPAILLSSVSILLYVHCMCVVFSLCHHRRCCCCCCCILLHLPPENTFDS